VITEPANIPALSRELLAACAVVMAAMALVAFWREVAPGESR
jgi:hypothetical protein